MDKVYEAVRNEDMVTYGVFSKLELAKKWVDESGYEFIVYETEVDGGEGLDSTDAVYQNYQL